MRRLTLLLSIMLTLGSVRPAMLTMGATTQFLTRLLGALSISNSQASRFRLLGTPSNEEGLYL